MSSISLFQNEESPEFKLLCVFVFDILISKLTNKNIKTYFPPSLINEKFPVFVTWSKGKEKNLRGCIGTFYPDNLKKNLENFGLTAAFKDSRFPPISKEEIEDLNCGISILINFEEAKDCYDWEVGKHGIQIYFEKNRQYTATFLPEVPIEHNMDKKTTLQHLIEKAGYSGKLKDVDKIIKMRRYQSIKIFMSYKEYLNYKHKEMTNQDL